MELVESTLFEAGTVLADDENVVRGVKALGVGKGRSGVYSDSVAAKSAHLYEGAKVNIDHLVAGKPGGPEFRSFKSRFAIIKNVRHVPGKGNFADLEFNPEHQEAKAFRWWVNNHPECIGLSHHARGPTEMVNGERHVKEITEVLSVDLVADPATAKGLFESAPVEGLDMDLQQELVEAKSGIAQRDTQIKTLQESLAATVRELDGYKAREAVASKRAQAQSLVEAAKLPPGAVSDVFMEALLAAADEAAMQKLVEDRAALVKEATGRPLSKESSMFEARDSGFGGFNDDAGAKTLATQYKTGRW